MQWQHRALHVLVTGDLCTKVQASVQAWTTGLHHCNSCLTVLKATTG